MADFRYGFFVRSDNKKIESNLEEKSKASHFSDPKYKPGRVDDGGRQQPTVVIPHIPGTRYVTTTVKHTETAYSSSRDDFQHNHAKKYEPVKYSGLHHDKGNCQPPLALNHQIEFNKLLAKAQKEATQPKRERNLSEAMNDIGKAMEYLKEAVNLHSTKNNACSTSDHHKKDSCINTVDRKEAARRYGGIGEGANVATIDCKEAVRKYKGATV